MRTQIVCCVVTAFLAVGVAQSVRADWAGEIAGSNPLHWWRFEETEGDVVDDQGSADADGAYMGDVELGIPGLAGLAASFEGFGYVLVEEENLETDWTFEGIFSANVDDGATSQGIIGSLAGEPETMAIKAEQWNSTGLLGYTLFGIVDISFDELTPDELTYVAMVGTDEGVDLYLDGEFVGSDPTATALSRHVLAAGREDGAGGLVDPLTGVIDELVIYDRALGEDEIASHYASLLSPSLRGDFNADGVLDALDIDELTRQSASGANDAKYDLTGDGTVDATDVSEWISAKDIFKSWLGDADLDKEFNSGDLVAVLASGTYETATESVWSSGDFNGDGVTTSGDLVAALSGGGYENGLQPAVAAVPEPSSFILVLMGSLVAIRSTRRRK